MNTATDILNISIGLVMAMALTSMLIPQILRVSAHRRLYDRKGAHHTHTGAVSRLGGISFLPAIVLALVLTLSFNMLKNEMLVSDNIINFISSHVKLLTFTSGALLTLYLLGIADDIAGVKYPVKMLVQTIAAILAVIGGVVITDLHGLFGIHTITPLIAYPLSVMVILFITNAINLIDGIDGLASALTAVIMTIYGFIFVLSGEILYATIAFATVGALIPFFLFNVYGRVESGNKVFMGDTGALTLGFIISILSFKCCSMPVTPGHFNAHFALTIAPLTIPCLDLVRVFIHRLRHGRSPFMADHSHIHHKLLAVGYTQHQSTMAIVASSMLLVAADVSLSLTGVAPHLLFIINIAACCIVNRSLNKRLHRLRTALGPKAVAIYDD